MKGALRLTCGVIVSAIITMSINDVYATKLLHRNLYELVSLSERIFVGKCVSVRESKYDPEVSGILYTEYTFEVSETIKGNVTGIIVFRQYGLTKPRIVGENVAIVKYIPAMPLYREGQEYVLFLIGDSVLGLTSPVGLFQGAFIITRDYTGRKVVLNGIQNLGLFKDMPVHKLNLQTFSRSERALFRMEKGAIHLETFISLVKKIAESKK